MSIEKRVTYFVQCDACGYAYNWSEFDSVAQAAQALREDGWKVEGCRKPEVTCPECVAHGTVVDLT
jgi:hypothetical protein